jgi:hypothetical protein
MTTTQLIKGIQKVLKRRGNLTTADMEMNCSPIYTYTDKNHFSTIERFNMEEVEVVTYIHEMEVDVFRVSYKHLDYDLLFQIHNELTTFDTQVVSI